VKRALAISAAIATVLLVPFAGPSLGLAGFRAAAPVPGSAVAVDDDVLNVYQDGAGRAVVLVHGQPGSADMMRPLAAALTRRGMQVVRYDRLGWGHSPERIRDTPDNPTAHARDLLGLVDALALHRPAVIGYSYGGGVAMEASRLAPDRLGPLVLVASVGSPLRDPGSIASASDRPEPPGLATRFVFHPLTMRWTLGTDWTARAAAARVFAPLEAPETLAPVDRASLLASLAMDGVPTHWARERRERFAGFDGYTPAELAACVAVVHGDGDLIVPHATAATLAGAIRGATLVTVAGAGHALVLTRPEPLAAIVENHLRTCPS
jgi:pimeloyl-ACP methyl ester carboxylesterase